MNRANPDVMIIYFSVHTMKSLSYHRITDTMLKLLKQLLMDIREKAEY